MSLVKLGQSIIKNVVIKKFRIISNIDILSSKFKFSCPTNNELIKIINQKNKLLSILNQLKRNIIKLDKSTKPLKPLLKALSTSSKLLKLSPLPLAVGAPAVAVTMGAVITASDSLQIMNQKVIGFKSSISSFEEIKKYILKTIEEILLKLNELDVLIEKCSNSSLNNHQNIINKNSNNVNNQINNQINILNQNSIVNQEDNSLNNEIQQIGDNENQDLKNNYNGFSFEILIDNNNTTRFIKRYAVAKNSSGVILLKGESSFSSSSLILIDELKFIIDRDNLKAF